VNANRYFSVPFDGRNDVDIQRLRELQGGIVAYGRWIALLGILYDRDGIIELEHYGRILERELELDHNGLISFLDDCAAIGFIEAEAYRERNVVISHGVCNEIEYRRSRIEAGKKSGDSRRKAK